MCKLKPLQTTLEKFIFKVLSAKVIESGAAIAFVKMDIDTVYRQYQIQQESLPMPKFG